jgi:opacity protein-like surface antigen
VGGGEIIGLASAFHQLRGVPLEGLATLAFRDGALNRCRGRRGQSLQLESSSMNIPLKTGLLALACVMAAGAAYAEPGKWYVAGAVTASFLKDPDSRIDNAPTPGAELFITNGVDSGWGGQIAAGRTLGPLRLEAEIGQTRNKAKTYEVTSPISTSIPQTGSDRITRYMANAYYDFPKGSLPVQPYLGLGLGEAQVDVKTVASKPFGPPTPPTTLIDDSPHGFAWQLMAGAAVPISPNLSLTAQYRWFDAGRLKGHDTRGQSFRTEIAAQNLDVGLRYVF